MTRDRLAASRLRDDGSPSARAYLGWAWYVLTGAYWLSGCILLFLTGIGPRHETAPWLSLSGALGGALLGCWSISSGWVSTRRVDRGLSGADSLGFLAGIFWVAFMWALSSPIF